ncbi:hypothetical protein TAMA11512_20070 [Selenomonas sp. TAMA-11512]|uniref:ferredoxin n=1 Tax=Selenomonas sp. TAMA-11512 TaxID=3095337 RepID=UPI003086E365|nr:hypothetical protein TAMA11512_20070 [Selenomonas sp. TAMA-11512]
MNMDNVSVVIEKGTVSREEIERYIRKIRKNSAGRTLKRITFRREAAYLNLRYSFDGIPLERVRYIPMTNEINKIQKVG